MSTTTRLLAAATLFICSVANADLYTGHIASLEWKTHSSDVVLLVSVDSRSADRPTVKLVSVFSRPGDLVTEAESIADSWKPPVQKENEWPYRKAGDLMVSGCCLFANGKQASRPLIMLHILRTRFRRRGCRRSTRGDSCSLISKRF